MDGEELEVSICKNCQNRIVKVRDGLLDFWWIHRREGSLALLGEMRKCPLFAEPTEE